MPCWRRSGGYDRGGPQTIAGFSSTLDSVMTAVSAGCESAFGAGNKTGTSTRVRTECPCTWPGLKIIACTSSSAAPSRPESSVSTISCVPASGRPCAAASFHSSHRGRHEERSNDAERSFDVFVPLGREVRVAGLAPGAEGDRRNPQRDRDVRIRGGARELGVPAQGMIDRHGCLHEWVSARGDAGGPVTHEL